MRKTLSLAGLLLLSGVMARAAPVPEIAWRDWSDGAFAAALSEKKLVLLDLGAVWCHWCHVMDETTYRDPKVVALLGRHFVAVRVDQDARPDLSNRYEDYVGDTVSAGRAFLALYAATGDRAWLARAREAADFMAATFVVAGEPGLVTAVSRTRVAPPRPQREENVLAARFLGLLFRYTADERYRRETDQAVRYLAARDVAEKFPSASVLLVDAELSSEPAHLTIVGARDDPRTQALLLVALGYPTTDKRVELWDRREGPLPNSDVDFPELDAPAAFACAGGRCSLPSYTPEELRQRAAGLRESSGTP